MDLDLDAWIPDPATIKTDFDPTRLFLFARDRMNRPVEVQPHAEICAKIDAALGDCLFKGDKKRQLGIGVPRGSWKTSLAVQTAPAMILEINPNARILIDCYRHDMAKARLRANRRLIEDLFPTWRPEGREIPWSDDQIVISTRTDTALLEPSIGTSGMDRTQTGYHYDVIFADDLVNDQNIRSIDLRQKVYDHILDLLPILAPGGVIIMPFTTWHTDDAYAKIQKVDELRIRENKAPFWEMLLRSAYNEDGTLYFPSTLTHAYLEDQLAQMGSAKFSAQYLLQPIADEDRVFSSQALRIANFGFYGTSEGDGVIVPREAILTSGASKSISHTQIAVAVTMAWDPAGRKGQARHDFHGFTVVGDDATDRWWFLAAERHKGVPTAIVDIAIDLILRYHPHTVSCEDVSQSGLWLELLQKELERRGIPLPILHYYDPGSVPKSVRIELLQPRWERGGMVLQPTQVEMIRQVTHFSAANSLDHEDILDSAVQHLEIARPAEGESRQPVNPTDPEWLARRERLGLQEMAQTGRSANRWAV